MTDTQEAPERIWAGAEMNPNKGWDWSWSGEWSHKGYPSIRPQAEYIRADLARATPEAETPAVRVKVSETIHNFAKRNGWHPSYVTELVTEVLAALEPAPVQGWQPMETAPREDCKDALLATNEGVQIGWWSAQNECWLTYEGKYTWGDPTHWMPLPAPPETP